MGSLLRVQEPTDLMTALGSFDVLLLEPDPARAQRLTSQLEETSGAAIALTQVDTLARALEVVEDEDFDVVLATAKALEDARGTIHAIHLIDPELPLVILASDYAPQLAVAVVEAGAQDCLDKQNLGAPELGRAVQLAQVRAKRRAELTLAHSRFETLLSASDQPALVLDPRGKVLFVNAGAEELLGEVAHQLRGRRLEAPSADATTLALPGGLASVFVNDTLWRGRLAILVNLQAFAAGDEASPAGERPKPSRYEGLRTASPAMRRLFEVCDRVAPTPASVLLLGETGTGKELLARAIHRRSGRKGRFVAIDCGAIPENLLESELFGHVKGAFTGASRDRVGAFQRADGGTLMLDEVGHLSLSAQHSLLRVLQERTVRPVGSDKESQVDVRVIAATSTPLFQAVEQGDFREDLLYRLDVIRIEAPPLRDRPEDVLHLFKLFSREVGERYELDVPVLGRDFVQAMVRYPWPGNVRQLENFAERLLLTAPSCESADDFEDLVRPARAQGGEGAATAGGGEGTPSIDLSLSLQDYLDLCERAYIDRALEDQQGRVKDTAKLAGINRRTLLRKLNKHELNKFDYR